MRKQIIVLASLLILVTNANANILVHDPIHTAMNQLNWILTEVKQGLQYVEQQLTTLYTHLTALRELQQIENEVLQLERMGDPKAYGMGLPGISNITTLAAIYHQAQIDYSDITGMVKPQNLKVGWEQIEGLYGQDQWNGFDSTAGWHVGPATGLINFYATNYNVGYSTQQTIQLLNAKKLELTQQRDAAIAQMQTASDQSAVQKQQAIITALNGAIADVNGSIAQAIQTGNMQIRQNEQAQGISENIATQRQAAAVYQSVDQDVMALPVSGVHGTLTWGQ